MYSKIERKLGMSKRLYSIIVGLGIMLLFSGCNSNAETVNSKNNGEKIKTNSYYSFDADSNQTYWKGNCIKKAEKGYYYFYNNRLYFWDKETMESILVCIVPDCKHKDEYCNAYFGSYGDKLQYDFLDLGLEITDKNIYAIGYERSEVTDFYLYRISRDGTEREKLFYLYSTEKDYYFYEYIMHRGNLYQAVINEERACLEKTSLDNKVTTIIDLSQYYGVCLDTILGYGDYIYFDAAWYEDKEQKKLQAKLYRYNVNTDKLEVVLDDFICNGYQMVDENCMIYMELDYSIKKMDIRTGKEIILRPTDGNFFDFSYDGVYLYINNHYDNKIEVYNLDGNKIDEIEFYGGNCYFGDSEYLFVQDMADKNGELSEEYGTYILDKSQIGSDKKEWKGLEYYGD